jgi:hypothetical protein
MTPQLRLCSSHHQIEVLPGIWQQDRLLTQATSTACEVKEVACPTCLQTARDLFQQQFPALYASSALAARKSA